MDDFLSRVVLQRAAEQADACVTLHRHADVTFAPRQNAPRRKQPPSSWGPCWVCGVRTPRRERCCSACNALTREQKQELLRTLA
jgi:hypothetical protein